MLSRSWEGQLGVLSRSKNHSLTMGVTSVLFQCMSFVAQGQPSASWQAECLVETRFGGKQQKHGPKRATERVWSLPLPFPDQIPWGTCQTGMLSEWTQQNC